MRIRSVAVLVAAVATLVGCGGGSSDPVAGVRTAMHQFVDDLLNGNYSGACDLMTSSARAQVGGSQCAARLGEAMQFASASQKATARKQESQINTYPVSVHGDTATVSSSSGGAPTTFVKQNGKWLLGGGAAAK